MNFYQLIDLYGQRIQLILLTHYSKKKRKTNQCKITQIKNKWIVFVLLNLPPSFYFARRIHDVEIEM